MQSAIELKGLVKRFGEREALSGLTLAVPAGTTFGLVGPNGAGKTTLFRILAGLSRPSGGEVAVLGTTPDRARSGGQIGYMTQAEALYQELGVEENVRFFGSLFGLSGAALDKATAGALELVHLEDRADDRIQDLSGGMRRRASLACAVVHRPRLLLLDEPTVGVDPELRAEFWDEFLEWGKAGTTLLISTHHLDEASRCARLGLLRAGAVIAEGAPSELLEQAEAETVEEAFLTFARRQA
ncbi:MAG: ABC transporter ATP-binding protein [Deltaproteobacteria bacterium]|nr:ABC transporter ATP-binding protein [Deltaproteobacteria bacterium]